MTPPVPPASSPPVQAMAQVAFRRPVGAYVELGLSAPAIAGAAAPGQFVAFAVGGPTSANLLRRSIAISGVGGGRVHVVVSPHGPGSTWLAGLQPGAEVDVVGPLGRPFPLPPPGTPALLVGGGYGAAALVGLAGRLRDAGSEVAAVSGAASADRLCSVEELGALAAPFLVTTDDGSAGRRGWVTTAVAELIHGAGVVYACGPMGMLRAVSDQAVAVGIPGYVAVEESMACGIGVCMTCVLPIVGADGRTRFARSCVEGPVFGGDRVRFGDVGTLPGDVVGADAMGLVTASAPTATETTGSTPFSSQGQRSPEGGTSVIRVEPS
ncbi:dihydroorotate oxidase B, electron transfer subunit [Modestobacter sp. DSM 44400]|uniref:iron-sulfur cluster-binding protein n=1 Tax=Modestobacter sp. DSM 44400 TaxID=1550230 RepID=UPI00089BF419|nr:dihydroorotate dehydrogenase electron transfer subunit [Modestobacter sp. DSM 44400]SDX61224.1 dihydroorotate oxidase B, electron transfer subunit [Modestobacter sp. DSM 44400]